MTQTHILLESGTNELEIVEFFLDEPGYRGHYGVNVAKVVEIIRMQPPTAMPQMRHPAVMGAFSHRDGKVVPLVNLAQYLGKESTPNTQDTKVIVTEFNGLVTGFMVSGVTRIHRLSWTSVEEPGVFLQNVSRSSITGVVRLEGRVVFILDMENVVAELDPTLAIRFHKLPDSLTDNRIYTVLHADDSNGVRMLVKRLLEESGHFNVIQTVSGEEAWITLKKLEKKAGQEGTPLQNILQAVITDIEMPRMDGLTLCRKIKEDPALRYLPVALFSSLVSHASEHKGKAVGADAQFVKPDLQRLSEKVLELLQTKGGEASPAA
jgi:two-component system chemotaxis response regulator CheV